MGFVGSLYGAAPSMTPPTSAGRASAPQLARTASSIASRLFQLKTWIFCLVPAVTKTEAIFHSAVKTIELLTTNIVPMVSGKCAASILENSLKTWSQDGCNHVCGHMHGRGRTAGRAASRQNRRQSAQPTKRGM